MALTCSSVESAFTVLPETTTLLFNVTGVNEVLCFFIAAIAGVFKDNPINKVIIEELRNVEREIILAYYLLRLFAICSIVSEV